MAVDDMTSIPRPIRDELGEWLDFLIAESHVLQEFPGLLRQQAANQPETSAVAARASSLMASSQWPDRPWVRWINRPRGSARSLTIVAHKDEITQLALSPDGTRLVSVSHDGIAKVWEYPSGRALFDLKGDRGPDTIATAGEAVIGGCADGSVRVWDLLTGDIVTSLRAPEGPITDLALSPDGTRLAFGYPGTVRILDLAGKKEFACLEGRAPLVFSPDGRYLAFGSAVFDIETGRSLCPVSGRVAFSPDGRLMADGREGPFKVRDLETGLVRFLLVGHTHWIGAMAFAHDGRIVSTGKHGEIMIWDLDPGLSTETTEYIPWVETGEGTDMRGYEVKVLGPRREIEGHRGTISALVMLPDGRRFLTIEVISRQGPMIAGVDVGIKVWDLDLGSLLGCVRGHGDRITAYALTPDRRHVITGDGRGIIRAWDIDKMDLESGDDTSSGHVLSLGISPDGRTVFADTTRGKFAIDARSGRTVDRPEPAGPFGKGVRSLDLGGGRWTVASVEERNMLEIREAPAGPPLARFLFSEEIEELEAGGSLIAAGGSGTGNVYILEFRP